PKANAANCIAFGGPPACVTLPTSCGDGACSNRVATLVAHATRWPPTGSPRRHVLVGGSTETKFGRTIDVPSWHSSSMGHQPQRRRLAAAKSTLAPGLTGWQSLLLRRALQNPPPPRTTRRV